MEKAKATYMDVDSPIPYANSPRLDDNAADAVAAGIKEFGFKVPIAVDGENAIIDGRTRPKAAHRLGSKQVPVIVADDLTPGQVKASRPADNKTGELAQRDDAPFDSMSEFVESTGAASPCIATGGAPIGGMNGVYPKGPRWNFNQACVPRTGDRLKFVGLPNEDLNATLPGANVGQTALEVMGAVRNAPSRGTDDGGPHGPYVDDERYIRDLYSPTAHPSGLGITVGDGRAPSRKASASCYPKIPSGRWRENGQ